MDRKVVTAIVLMMAVAIIPSMLLRPKPGTQPPNRPGVTAPATPGADTLSAVPPPAAPVAARPDSVPAAPSAGAQEDSVVVTSPLYRYVFSTRGARMTGATLANYPSMRPEENRRPVQLMRPESDLLSLGFLAGRDTVSLADWPFAPSVTALNVTGADRITFNAVRGGLSVEVTYHFRPDNYLIEVSGLVTGLGQDGGTAVVGMGPGPRNTESDSVEHVRETGLVVKDAKANLTRFGKLKLHQPQAFNGPFEWVAIKSKYFVTALLALDSSGTGLSGGISGVTAVATDTGQRTTTGALIRAGIPVPGNGKFRYQVYAGPMEYPRLRAIGHDFDDVNPYGWPGFRTIIRPVALAARSLLVWMHDSIGIAYGLGLVIFGILIRILLWPLNQKAMRSTMAMQVVQPLIKEIQEKHKSDPQRLQQEMFKLYKEHKVNPFGGCWPMLLPWPILLALFFVFQNTIELRGASFLWLPDLSRADPTYVIPILMGVSMYALSKIGQLGMAPNPQMKIMLYMLPVMMTVLFAKFASGLNLYYTVMNLASLPQQWMLSQERMRMNPIAPKPAPAPAGGQKKLKK